MRDDSKLFPVLAIERFLDVLLTIEQKGHPLPLTLERFLMHVGATDSVSAIRKMTDSVLRAYETASMRPSSYKSIGQLCSIVGARLVGRRPSTKSTVPVYSIGMSTLREPSHKGTVQLDSTDQTIVTIPPGHDVPEARISVAHEIGHLLIHRRGEGYDRETIERPSTVEEEGLAEYAARLLLMPDARFNIEENLAISAMNLASTTRTTIHSAVSRLGDPEHLCHKVRGAILWRMKKGVLVEAPVHERFTPQWHQCTRRYVPIGKCHARANSLIAKLAAVEDEKPVDEIVYAEDVNIGNFKGTFRVDACSWGSLRRGTRLVLSVFCYPD